MRGCESEKCSGQEGDLYGEYGRVYLSLCCGEVNCCLVPDAGWGYVAQSQIKFDSICLVP